MRLSKQEISVIKSTIHSYIKDCKIILFGSRVDDNKKGGDIDLLVQTKESVGLQEKIEILTAMEYNGIERKVDLLFQTPLSEEKSIFKTALKEGIVL